MYLSMAHFLICVLGFATAVISATLPLAGKEYSHGLSGGFSNIENRSNREQIGIPEDLLQRFQLMAEYSAAAYCPGNNDSPGNQITCPIGNCPHVEAVNATTMEEFQNTRIADDTGFLAIDNVNRIIVLSFRGTSSKVNRVTDLKLIRTPTGWCKKCKAHLGFWEAWMEAKDMIMTKVMAAVTVHPDFRLVITGHSLGAAIATLAAGDIRRVDSHLLEITELYTFGSPRVGNTHLASYLSTQSNLSYRVTAVDDPIPRMPPYFTGYRHTSPEYWIHSNPDHPVTVDIRVLTGYYNSHGNSGTHWLKAESHRHYFGPISGCKAKKVSNKQARSYKSTMSGNASTSAIGPHGFSYELIKPYVNVTMLTLEEEHNESRLNRLHVTFPPGSVSEMAVEAIHGPVGEQDERPSTTVDFEVEAV